MEEDGNNVNSNFSVRATKNHMDLSEEHAKGHFYVRSVLGQLDCNFVWNHYINISSVLGWQVWTHCARYKGEMNFSPHCYCYLLVMFEILRPKPKISWWSSKAH